MKLNYNDRGNFKICQLTDLHLGESPENEEDNKTLNALELLFNTNEFDLVIITGDLIWSKLSYDPEMTLSPLYKLLNRFSFPVAITYGNHDTQSKWSRFDMRKLERQLTHPADKYNSTITGERENYTLEVYDGKKLANVIYVLDSGAYSNWKDHDRYASIEPEQIEWYNQLPYSRDENNVDLGFFHIPLPEYKLAAQNIIAGQRGSETRSPNLNSGFFYSLHRNRNVKALFVGHDHENNFVSQYEGIDLNYGNVTGYNCDSSLKRGVRIIELENNLYETSIKTFES
ncbi:metallophosphoesterase [Nicoliella lavandulae]|uniref:Metallophosphoesterase n=1 Tax=Nicoliella lavandulae TaxID=3082954 RepID=A0ABU8SNP4_9LACO